MYHFFHHKLLWFIAFAVLVVLSQDTNVGSYSLNYTDELDIISVFTSEIIAKCNNNLNCIDHMYDTVRSIKLKISYEQLLQYQRQYIPHSYDTIPFTAYLNKILLLQHIADDNNVDTICEISDSIGPSTIIFLISNPKAKITSFHQIDQTVITSKVKTILNLFPDRIINIFNGNSKQAINNFSKLLPTFKCNLIFFDKFYDQNDLYYFKSLANSSFNRIIVNNADFFDESIWKYEDKLSTIKTMAVYNTQFTPCISWNKNKMNKYFFNTTYNDCNYSEELHFDYIDNNTSPIIVGKYVMDWTLMDLIDNSRTDKNTVHSYIELYQTIFSSKFSSNKVYNVLEIGINNGGSIILWHDYFINANIHAIDLIDDSMVWFRIKNNKRIKLYTSQDAYNSSFVIEKLSNIQFDIIIDDGPHTLESMIKFIQLYTTVLSRYGILIIEDVQTIEWVDILYQYVPEYLLKYVKVYDRRHVKNRYDDIVFTIDCINYNSNTL